MSSDPPLLRRDVIAARLTEGLAVAAATLAREFDVSEDAIRRDLRALAAQGLCRRVYGGALPLTPATTTIAQRMDEGREDKQRLARAAAATIRPGELIFLDCGSTTLALAGHLPQDSELTVATNSIDIASALQHRPDIRLIVIGGQADPLAGGCVDGWAMQAVAAMRIDRAFLGACSVSAEEGIGAYHFADATFKRAVLAASRHATVMATADKLARRAPQIVAPLARIDTLVIDEATDAAIRSALGAGGSPHILPAPAA